MERRDEFRFRSGGVPRPDQFREPAVGDLARAIHDGLVEGGLSTSRFASLRARCLRSRAKAPTEKVACHPTLARDGRLCGSAIPQRDRGRRVPGDSRPFNPHVAP